MTLFELRVREADSELALSLAALRVELEITEEFPPVVLDEARRAADTAVLPQADLREIPFITIDPSDAMDLDQAMRLERSGDGYLVRYAIADVASFVTPGGAIDSEAHKRGQTYYPPDGRIPLHPVVISEQAASLAPEEVRGAYVWTFDLDAQARVTGTRLERAQVRSIGRYDYDEVQALIDSGEAPEAIALLKEIGVKRIEIERERGGASLGRPDQEVRETNGHYELIRRQPFAAEGWNAQISLMTGMAAAAIMIEGKVGILRTMPRPDDDSIAAFSRSAAALGTPWPDGIPYGEYLRTLNPADPYELAIMHAAATLFRGAGYTAFDGEVPEIVMQSAVAAPYAHATAPLRRLVDRFVLAVCEALSNGREIPGWARGALPELPAIMSASDNLAGRLNNESLNRVEAAILWSRVGEIFPATVLKVNNGGGHIQLDDPAVTAECEGEFAAGESIQARLMSADIASGAVRFELV